MPKYITPPKPGRPPRNLIDVLRTQLWFHVVKLHSGLPSAYALEKKLEPHLVHAYADGVVRPRKWDAYERGSRIPKRKHDQSDAVELAERQFPGTAAWFDSPIWALLKGATPDRWALQRLLRSLSSAVVDVLITTNGTIVGQAELVKLAPTHFDRLVSIGGLDALAAIAILARLSEETASVELREMVLGCYVRLQPVLAASPDTCVHYPELFTYMDKICQHWIEISPGNLLTMHLFWHSNEWAQEHLPYFAPRLGRLSRAHGWGNDWEHSD